MFETQYPPYQHEIEAFGDAWCGPELYKTQIPHLVARYESSDDFDGQVVEIYCTPMPARFYTIRALEGTESIGGRQAAFELGTGSGMAQLAANMGKAIADGMLVLSCSGKEAAGDPVCCPFCDGHDLSEIDAEVPTVDGVSGVQITEWQCRSACEGRSFWV